MLDYHLVLNRSRRKFGGDAGQCEGEGGAGRRVGYHCTFLAWNKKTAWMEGNRVRRVDGGERRRKEYCVMQGDLSGGGQHHQFHLLQKWKNLFKWMKHPLLHQRRKEEDPRVHLTNLPGVSLSAYLFSIKSHA